MVHRQRRDDDFLRLAEAAGDPLVDLFQCGEEVGVREHRPLGDAGRAAGVLQEGNVVVGDRDRLERGEFALLERPSQRNCARQVPVRHHFFNALDREIEQPALRCRHHVADLRGDDVLDGRVADDFLQGGGEILEDDDRLGPGILELCFELARREQRIDIDHRHAGPQDAEEHHRVLQQIRHHDGDPVALLQSAQLLQVAGERLRHLVESAETQVFAEIAERRLVRVLADRLVEEIEDGSVAGDVDIGGDAGRVAFQPDAFSHVGCRTGIAPIFAASLEPRS